MANLVLFKLISRVTVNFYKIILVVVNVFELWLVKAAVILNCKTGHISFVFMGLLIGGNHHRLSFWQSLLDKIRKRLSVWKSKNLYTVCRVVLSIYGLLNMSY